MLRYLIGLCALGFLLTMTPDAHGQKRKKKPKTSVNKKAAQKATARRKAWVPLGSGAGSFDAAYTLHGNRKELSSKVKDPDALAQLDAFINSCIAQRAFPGCQVFAAKDGEIVYWKNFGHYTYDKTVPVTDTTMYDIASVTKVAATTLAIMKLYEQDEIDLDAQLKTYLPFTLGTDKGSLTVKDLLLHQAGLKAFIPFYKETVDKDLGAPKTDWFRTSPDKNYTLPVAPNFYMRKNYLDTIWDQILQSPLENKGRYVYSDLDFYFLEKIVEERTGMPIDQYVAKFFYEPLKLRYTMYNPWKKGLQYQCPPTEYDDYFRFQIIQGYVHDPGTAMSGGVAGHAGVFSNVKDLSVILQMLNNGGEYKGQRYFDKETLQMFTGYRSTISRRAYGFDKPEKAAGDGGPASNYCSKTTFGHQGFTGTCAWADPETGIIFIFLSNRTYPSASNSLINTLKVRFKAQSYIYQALGYAK